jgi:hypothetical protein
MTVMYASGGGIQGCFQGVSGDSEKHGIELPLAGGVTLVGDSSDFRYAPCIIETPSI